MLYGENIFDHTTYSQMVHVLYVQNDLVHTTYIKVVNMLYGKVAYMCHTDKNMRYETEQVNNESIYMTYLGKIYMYIVPTGHNI